MTETKSGLFLISAEGIPEMKAEVRRRRSGIERAVRYSLMSIGAMVVSEIARSIKSSVPTGRLYTHYFYTDRVTRKRKRSWRKLPRPHRASAPGQVPANWTGRLAKSFSYRISTPTRSLWITSSHKAADWLHTGTKDMMPRPFVPQAIKKVWPKALDRVAKIIQREIGDG